MLLEIPLDNTSDADTYTFNSYALPATSDGVPGRRRLRRRRPTTMGLFHHQPQRAPAWSTFMRMAKGLQAGRLFDFRVGPGRIPTVSSTTAATEVESYTYQSPGSSTVHDPLATTDYPNAVPGSAGTGVTTADTADLSVGFLAIEGGTHTLPAVRTARMAPTATSFDYITLLIQPCLAGRRPRRIHVQRL